MVHHIHRRTAHVFQAELSVPLERLTLLAGSIWSKHLGCHRPLADGLQEVMQQVLSRGAVPRGSGAAVRWLFSGNSLAWQ
jgi:hypothetical protein